MRGFNGLQVGHVTDLVAMTGCTVILLPPGTTAGVAVPGISPATRETDALRHDRADKFTTAFLLTGGSAYGLDAAGGVMAALEARGIGHPTPIGVVPIVPTAAILDLSIGDPTRRPSKAEGIAAVEALTDESEEGSVGGGTGATCGKYAGFEYRMKGGLGIADGARGALKAVAVVVANPVGDVIDEGGEVLAGSSSPDAAAILDAFLRGESPIPGAGNEPPGTGSSTTLVALVTNARLTQTRACRLAEQIATRGFAASINPPGTQWDGDTVFLAGTNQVDASDEDVVSLCADVLADGVRRAVMLATSLGGVPAYRDSR